MRTDTTPSETLLFASLERRVSKQTFDTWFRPLTVNSSPGEKVFRFSAPNPIVKDWVMAHYNETITQSLRELSLDHYRVEWCLASKTQKGEPATATNIARAPQSIQNREENREQSDQITALSESFP